MAAYCVDPAGTLQALGQLIGIEEPELARWQTYCDMAAGRVTSLLREPEAAYSQEEERLLETAAAGMAWRMGLLRQLAETPQTLEIGELRSTYSSQGVEAALELETALLLSAGHLLRLSPYGLWPVSPEKEG